MPRSDKTKVFISLSQRGADFFSYEFIITTWNDYLLMKRVASRLVPKDVNFDPHYNW